MASLTRVIGEWTAPDFLSAVVAREGVDLDPAAITMITLLSFDGPLRPSTLATKMVTGASNVSKVVARLEASGMVDRISDPADARASLVNLTPAGHLVAQSFVRAGDGLVADLLQDWSPQERTDLVRLLAKLEQSTIAFSAQLRANHDSAGPFAPETTKGAHQ
ncbi:MarR family winged helix-turn-helix transcriptional regulator [Specibacter sp. NPDC057265]|uniref:MarR family winged helix-turn-helix transcriptional regulator n=1 Tax=Specibacter sp. NPDC057265 TaxID=3346075 RepID=UPI0036399B37